MVTINYNRKSARLPPQHYAPDAPTKSKIDCKLRHMAMPSGMALNYSYRIGKLSLMSHYVRKDVKLSVPTRNISALTRHIRNDVNLSVSTPASFINVPARP